MGMPNDPWVRSIRELHDWSLGFNWEVHLQTFNKRHCLGGDEALSTSFAGWPPAWFNGDIEGVAAIPNSWLLVVPLNPARADAGHYSEGPKEHSWGFWRTHNRDAANWNAASRFFPRLVDLASLALGEPVEPDQRPAFATVLMLFLEFCPYASKTS